MTVYASILKRKAANKKSIAIVIDPDKANKELIINELSKITSESIRYIFVGGSLLSEDFTSSIIDILKKHSKLPIISFPGNVMQINTSANAILFLSLISGRNPEYLIGQHIVSAPRLHASGIEVIPTGYILIDGGNVSSTTYISNTLPIPSTKTDIAACTALAGEMLGLKLLYLEAGSGAVTPVSQQMIKKVRGVTTIPIITGGGIRTPEEMLNAAEAGADIIVLGSVLEKDFSKLHNMGKTLDEYNRTYSTP